MTVRKIKKLNQLRFLTEKESKILLKKQATPSEKIIFQILVNLYEEKKEPITNNQIRAIYGGHRTNVQHFLKSMKDKEIIKNETYRSYVPMYY